jgi:Tol biopolymer transport system component
LVGWAALSSSAAAGDPEAGKLAYQVHGSHGSGRIVAVDIGASSVRQLVPPSRHGWWGLGWSPNGDKLAAERNANGLADAIYVATDAGRTKLVARPVRRTYIRDVTWSPTSSRLAFVRPLCAGSSVWVVDAEGKHLRRVTRPTRTKATVWVGDWSPSGNRLLYGVTTYDYECGRSDDAIRSTLFTVAAGGGRPQVVAKFGGNFWRAVWSLTGSQIAYLECDFADLLPCQPWIVNLDGKNRRKVGEAVNMRGGIDLAWTPDGGELVLPYMCAPGRCVPQAPECDATWSYGLRAIDVTANRTRTIVSRNGCGSAELLAISRSSRTLAFGWTRTPDGVITGRPMLAGLDGSNVRPLQPPPKVAGARVDPVPAVYLP